MRPTQLPGSLARMIRHALFIAAAGALLAPAPAAASAYETLGGACVVEFRVRLGAEGQLVQTEPAVVRCVGAIGRATVDPGPAAAEISGSFRPGATACTPRLASGQLRLLPRRLISFDARPEVPFQGSWKAGGLGAMDVVDGTGVSEGLVISFAGDARLTPGPGSCLFATLQMDLVFMPR